MCVCENKLLFTACAKFSHWRTLHFVRKDLINFETAGVRRSKTDSFIIKVLIGGALNQLILTPSFLHLTTTFATGAVMISIAIIAGVFFCLEISSSSILNQQCLCNCFHAEMEQLYISMWWKAIYQHHMAFSFPAIHLMPFYPVCNWLMIGCCFNCSFSVALIHVRWVGVWIVGWMYWTHLGFFCLKKVIYTLMRIFRTTMERSKEELQ